MQEIIIPWRDSGCHYRTRHFNALIDYYSQSFKVVIGDNDGEFSRSAARNAGVAAGTSDVVVLIDADNLIPLNQIHTAVTTAKQYPTLVKPFKRFGYLTEESTHHVYGANFENPHLLSLNYINPPQTKFNGGAYAMRRDVWERVGGFDEEFVGWGAEDDAFHIMCEKKLGRTLHVTGMDYHLYHPAYRVTSKENYERLMRVYVNGN